MKDTSTAAETIEAALRGAAGWGDSSRPTRLIQQHREEVAVELGHDLLRDGLDAFLMRLVGPENAAHLLAAAAAPAEAIEVTADGERCPRPGCRIRSAHGHSSSTDAVLQEIRAERARQDARWGEQNHPDGTGLPVYQHAARRYRDAADRNAAAGMLTWRDISNEEHFEALAESDPARLRAELVQDAAVKVAWIECIDRRARDQKEST